MESYAKSTHFWGRLTLSLGILISFALPIYISFVMGYHPGFPLILNAFFAYAAVVGVVWFVEPIMYYPVLGSAGTYIAFFTGNISNMCLPAVAACQEAVGVEPSTEKGETVATLGISAASLVNKLILVPVILAGLWLLTVIPESIQDIFPYVLPAIFGAVFVQFAGKLPWYGLLALAIGFMINISPVPLFAKNLICILLLVSIMLFIDSRKNKASEV